MPALCRLRNGLGLLSACWLIASCHEGIDTTRQGPRKATLGDDIFGLFCDRVGASSLTEDLTGASYHAVCHPSSKGKYADKVDEKVLPEVSGEEPKRSRRLGLAKIEAMARRRSDLIRAFNAVFPDIEIDNVATEKPGDKVELHEALITFSQKVAPLYEKNPYDKNGEPLLPGSTRALGRLFDALAESDEARESLARIWGRQGYRPFPVALGAIRPAIAYPALRSLATASLEVLGPKGNAVPQLQQLLKAAKHELRTARAVVTPLPNLTTDQDKAEPSRPRTNIEVAASILLAQDSRFAASPDELPRYISRRDRRGFVVPLGNEPGLAGTIAEPFTDLDSDGFADVDAFGRFVDADGLPVVAAPPFALPGALQADVDDFGRPLSGLYQYIDTSRALTGALARSFLPMLDSTQYAAPGDPGAWASEHETMMYAMAGGYFQYGGRETAQYDYANEAILPGDAQCDECVSYLRFRGEDSPVPDLVHAMGQVLADEDSDALLLGTMDLIQNHEQVVTRLVGALLRVREIAHEHDLLAQQGTEPFAALPYESPIWDEMGAIIARIVQRPGLAGKLLGALAKDTIVQPIGGSNHMGETLSLFMGMRDELTYNPSNINGPTLNVTDGGGSTMDPHNPVDRKAPIEGKNRSCFQRSGQMIHDASKVKACNKQGAKVFSSLGPIDVTFPPIGGGYDECDLFSISSLGAFYLDTLLPASHKKRAEMNIKPGVLNGLLDLIGIFMSPDDLLQGSSGIDGMTLHPGPHALNRLVFFGASSGEYPNMPDHDTQNEDSNTDKFVKNLIEPVAAAVCAKKPNGVPHCGAMNDLLRIRDANTIFLWERLGFYDYLQPVVTVFANESCSSDLSICDVNDLSGEQIFVDIIDTLHRHWSGKDHGPECDNTGSAATNTRYCSEAGANTYEPMLVDAFRTDLIPALHEFAKAATELSKITIKRGPKAGQEWTGAQVLEKFTQILFDPKYAASVKMVDRQGNASTTWTDGTPQPQVTVFSLFADALHRIDLRFDQACSCDGLAEPDLSDCQTAHEACLADAGLRKAQWKRARSQFVDAFFAVEGDGPTAKFHNDATVPILLAVTRTLREQLNANCPDRENGTPCTWAKTDLGQKMATTVSGPLFASIMDVQEAIRDNEGARRELEKFMTYVLLSATEGEALHATLASASDILQIIADDGDMSPIFQAAASAANPAGDQEGSGCADNTIKMMKALTSDTYDPQHVLDHVLPLIVTPMDDGKGPAPIEIFLDTIAEVNRIDAASAEPLEAKDYKAIMGTVRDFFGSKTRGLEQFYTIVQSRPRE